MKPAGRTTIPRKSWTSKTAVGAILSLAAAASPCWSASPLAGSAEAGPGQSPAASQRDATPTVDSRQRELSIDDLVEQVLARNPSLAQMVAAWQAASARYPQVTSLDDPMFGATVAPASIGSNNVEFGYRLEVSQKYPSHGKLSLKGEAALAEASAAGHDIEDMRLQLVKSAKNAFYDYYLVDRALSINQESLKILKEFRQNAESQYKNGKVSQQDVLQADVEIGRQNEREFTLERMRQVAIARINTLLNLPPDSPLAPPPEQLSLPESLPDAAVLRSYAVAQRPDLKGLADRIRAEQAGFGLAQKDFRPDFEVSAAYDTIMGNGPMRDLAPQVGVRLNLPLRKERRYGALAEAQAKIAQRQAELCKQLSQVNFQVQEAYLQVRESEKIVALYEKSILPAARDNVKAAQVAYVNVKVPFLSLIEAQRNVVMLGDRRYEAIADYFRRRATLERVIGGPMATEIHTPSRSPSAVCPASGSRTLPSGS